MENAERTKRPNMNLMTSYTKGLLERNLNRARSDLSQSQLAIGEAAGRESDWHDNAAFDQANADFSLHSARVANLEKKLKNVEIITPRQETDRVDIGNTVVVKFQGEEEETYTILGPDDAGKRPGWLSYLSPLATCLVGKRAGETSEFTIEEKTFNIIVIQVLPGNFEAGLNFGYNQPGLGKPLQE